MFNVVRTGSWRYDRRQQNDSMVQKNCHFFELQKMFLIRYRAYFDIAELHLKMSEPWLRQGIR